MTDLAEIKARWRYVRDAKDGTPVALGLQIDPAAKFEIGWLISEAERLQELADERGREIARLWALVKQLEAAGLCPACGGDQHHARGCWLVAWFADSQNANKAPPP